MHHGATAGLAHMWHDGTGGVDHGFEIDGEDLVPDAHVHIEQRGVAAEPQHAGDIGEIIEPPEALGSSIDGAADEAFVGEVALDRLSRGAHGILRDRVGGEPLSR